MQKTLVVALALLVVLLGALRIELQAKDAVKEEPAAPAHGEEAAERQSLSAAPEQSSAAPQQEVFTRHSTEVAPDADFNAQRAAAVHAMMSGQLARGRELASQALKIYPDSLEAEILLGVCAFGQKDYRTAEQCFQAANQQAANNFPASNNLALALCEQNDEAKRRRALQYAEKNARQYPWNTEAASTYGWVLYKLGRLDDAEKVLLALPTADMSGDTAYYVARVSVDRGRKHEAQRLLEAALKKKVFFCMRPDADSLLAQLDSNSQYTVRAGDLVTMLPTTIEVKTGAGVLAVLHGGEIRKVVETKGESLLVELNAQGQRGWVPRRQVIRCFDDRAEPSNPSLPAAMGSVRVSAGTLTVDATGAPPRGSGYIFVPVYRYSILGQEEVRKQLKFSSDQEQKLREISRHCLEQLRKAGEEERKEAEKPAPPEGAAQQREIQTRLAQETRSLRQQVEELLAAEQLAGLHSTVVGFQAVGRLLYDPQFGQQIGVTEEQKKELTRRLEEDKQRQKVEQALQQNEQKMLTLITPQQWDAIERIVGKSDLQQTLVPGMIVSFPPPELMALSSPEVRKKLELSAGQETKLQTIFAKSPAASSEFSKAPEQGLLPAQQQRTKQTQFQRKLEEMARQVREQTAGLLTAQQLAALRKISLRNAVLHSLSFGPLAGADQGQPGILQRIHATEEQKQQLRRLREEGDRMTWQMDRETGEKALKVLSPQQQEKLFEELDRQGPDFSPAAPEAAPGAAKPAGSTQSAPQAPQAPPTDGAMIKIGVGRSASPESQGSALSVIHKS